jgi:transposase
VEDLTLPSAIRLREDYSAEELRGLARRSKTVNQSRRFLSLAAVRDGMDRGSAAKIRGMDRQTLRDWVHRFNGSGPEGLVDNWTEGPKPRLSAEQLAQFAQIVESGPDREKDGVVRWRRKRSVTVPQHLAPGNKEFSRESGQMSAAFASRRSAS